MTDEQEVSTEEQVPSTEQSYCIITSPEDREPEFNKYVFRGKLFWHGGETGQWVVGYLCPGTFPGYKRDKRYEDGKVWYIAEERDYGPGYNGDRKVWKYRAVNPATVGMRTGVGDVSGKYIFEGDILQCVFSNEYQKLKSNSGYGYVRYLPSEARFIICYDRDEYGIFYEEEFAGRWKVIGNIYDNPDLSKLVKRGT